MLFFVGVRASFTSIKSSFFLPMSHDLEQRITQMRSSRQAKFCTRNSIRLNTALFLVLFRRLFASNINDLSIKLGLLILRESDHPGGRGGKLVVSLSCVNFG